MSSAVPPAPLAPEHFSEFRAQMREYPIGRWLTGTSLQLFGGVAGGLIYQGVAASWPGLLGINAIAGMALFGVIAAMLVTVLLRNFMAAQLDAPDELLRKLQSFPAGDPGALRDLQGILKSCHRINWYDLLRWQHDQVRYAARHRKLSAVEKTLLAKAAVPVDAAAAADVQPHRPLAD
jgi:hypothetical protein